MYATLEILFFHRCIPIEALKFYYTCGADPENLPQYIHLSIYSHLYTYSAKNLLAMPGSIKIYESEHHEGISKHIKCETQQDDRTNQDPPQ